MFVICQWTTIYTVSSSPHIDVDFTTIATAFQSGSNPTVENSLGNANSLGRGMTPPQYGTIAALTIIGVIGVLSKVAVLAVLLQKGNRKVATNSYLINIAIGESAYISIAASSCSGNTQCRFGQSFTYVNCVVNIVTTAVLVNMYLT